MKRNVKWYIIERTKRINFIKTELYRLVGKSMFKNTFNKEQSVIGIYRHIYFKKLKTNTISNFRLFCMYNLSPKLVNKRYRLSRFSLNFLNKNASIPGFVKRGW